MNLIIIFFSNNRAWNKLTSITKALHIQLNLLFKWWKDFDSFEPALNCLIFNLDQLNKLKKNLKYFWKYEKISYLFFLRWCLFLDFFIKVGNHIYILEFKFII